MSLNVMKVLSVITFGPGWCSKVHDWNTEWSDGITWISQAIHFRCLLFQKLKKKVLGIITFHMNWRCLDFLRHYRQKGKDVSMESQIQCTSDSFTVFYLSFVTPLNSNFITEPHDIKNRCFFFPKVLNSKLRNSENFAHSVLLEKSS